MWRGQTPTAIASKTVVEVTITPDDKRANITTQCTNCRELGISPRDEGAEFQEICTNCRTFTPEQAWDAELIDQEPISVFWPQSITVTTIMTIITVAFVVLFYKELKLASFDEAVGESIGVASGYVALCLDDLGQFGRRWCI